MSNVRRLKKSKLLSNTEVKGNINANKSDVKVGGVDVKNSKVEKSEIISNTKVKGNINANKSDVNVGGVSVE